MKLLSLLLLGATALAATVPAPLTAVNAVTEIKGMNVNDAPGPDTQYAAIITVDPKDLSRRDLGDPQDGYWDYEVTFTERFQTPDLVNLTSHGEVHSRSGYFVLDFVGQDAYFLWVKLNDRDLQIFYDFNEHKAWFKYREARWALDKTSVSLDGKGICEVSKDWDKGVIQPGSTDSRNITCACKIKLDDGETIGPQHGPPKQGGVVAARHVASDAAAESQRYNYAFDVSVTEYCEAVEGTPLKARAYWQPRFGTETGVKIVFDDESTVMAINIAGHYLTVGSYDYESHQIGFHYNGCNWNQDIIGVGECGLCHSYEWSAPELDCASNAAAGRTHSLKCYFNAQVNSDA